MMELFGWLALTLIAFYLGFLVLLTIGNMGGTYNIGGVPNKWWERILAILVIPSVYSYMVYLLIIKTVPFSLIFKG